MKVLFGSMLFTYAATSCDGPKENFATFEAFGDTIEMLKGCVPTPVTLTVRGEQVFMLMVDNDTASCFDGSPPTDEW